MEESGFSELNLEQKDAVAKIISGKNVFLTGGAGVGKTKTVIVARNALTAAGKKVICVAPTGFVAESINGVTLHSCLGLKNGLLTRNEHGLSLVEPDLSSLRKADVVFCDEVSMISRPLLDVFWKGVEALRNEGHHLQVVFTGDFFQLPPVITKAQRQAFEEYYGGPIRDAFAFESECWDKFCFEYVSLTKVMRQKDVSFISMLNMIRKGDRTPLSKIKDCSSSTCFQNGMWIVSHRDMADLINAEYVSKISEEAVVMKAIVEGTCPNVSAYTSEELTIKKGMKVVFTNNIPSKNVTNGTEGTVLRWNTNSIQVVIPGRKGKVSVERYPFKPELTDDTSQAEFTIYQFPLVAGYARTSHGAQGCTKNYVNLKFRQCWSYGQLYVCLSRVQSLDCLYIDNSLSELTSSLRCSPTVKKWYEDHFPGEGAAAKLNGELPAEVHPPIYPNWDLGVRFGLKRFTFLEGGQPVKRYCIVLKSQNGNVVMLTDLDKFLSLMSGKHPWTSDLGEKKYFAISLLNFAIVDAKSIKSIIELTPEIASAYLYAYGIGAYGDRKRTKATINECYATVFQFMHNLATDPEIGPLMGYSAEDLVIRKPVITADKHISYRYEAVFTCFYDPADHEIVRDMPTEAIPIFLSTALQHSIQLFMMLTTQLCTLGRPAEICSISDYNAILAYEGRKLSKIQFDLREVPLLRSDLVPVGGIKKHRILAVHPLFTDLFNESYRLWEKHRLSPCEEDANLRPWFINANARAMTYKNYYHAFGTLLPPFVSALEATGDPKLCLYADLVRQERIAPHIMRHLGTAFLVLAGNSAEQIMYARGDSSIESARTYIENKGMIMQHESKEINNLFRYVRDAVNNLKKRER